MSIYTDFKGYFESAPGSVTPFAAGKLVMSKPEATYEGPDGKVLFGPDSDLEELYAIPSIKALWDSIYGKPFPMALVITGENRTTLIEDAPYVRLICPENVKWMHVDYWQAINLAARITAKKYPQADDRKDEKLCIVKGNPAPGQPPAEAHTDSGEQFDGGYYCKGDALLNYTQYAVSGGPLPMKIWDEGMKLNARFDGERTRYFLDVLRVICPRMTAIVHKIQHQAMGYTDESVVHGDPNTDLFHHEHFHAAYRQEGYGPSIDKRFSEMTFYEADKYVNEQIERAGRAGVL